MEGIEQVLNTTSGDDGGEKMNQEIQWKPTKVKVMMPSMPQHELHKNRESIGKSEKSNGTH